MIIIIKNHDKKRILIKGLSILFIFVMFYFYYLHMGNKFQNITEELNIEKTTNIKKKDIEKTLKIEKTIYKEAVVIVNLLEQKHVQSIKIIKDRLYIVCDYNTNIEPLLIRYGVNAYVKNTAKNIKIAIDLKTIVENKYES
ncbi:MAG: hypothetical protein U9Q04_05625 [Campylobacterota bacterium]|nr:hypothetical protein [Campylobacterota bacterium]